MPLLTGLLAAQKPIVTPDPDVVSPGFLGFVVVFLLAVVTVLLVRSMVGHLRKVRFNATAAQNTGAPTSPER
jgi:hypothetical protein